MRSTLGIDYGSKKAGTTAIAYVEAGLLHVEQSVKGKDADRFVREVVEARGPAVVYLDAPLSLPGVYRGAGTDYHYRKADRALGGMSPMFLGGLTARAMSLAATLREAGHEVIEVYPAHTARLQFPDAGYRSDLEPFTAALTKHLPHPLATPPASWHAVDAVVAWWIGWRHQAGEATPVGDAEEGVVWI